MLWFSFFMYLFLAVAFAWHICSCLYVVVILFCFLIIFLFYYLCKYIETSWVHSSSLNFLVLCSENSEIIYHSRRKVFIWFSQTSCFISFSFRSSSYECIILVLHCCLLSVTQHPQGKMEIMKKIITEAKKQVPKTLLLRLCRVPGDVRIRQHIRPSDLN